MLPLLLKIAIFYVAGTFLWSLYWIIHFKLTKINWSDSLGAFYWVFLPLVPFMFLTFWIGDLHWEYILATCKHKNWEEKPNLGIKMCTECLILRGLNR